ncbi:MAG: TIGR00730 family Rossman fold protein [Muribaculaceae bacterium]|nr:TIGR00730 family Rossman fold protein [Muribaculaceae bacterium]
MKGITIYGASSPKIDPKYLSAARSLGELVADSHLPLISGGGRAGVMAAAIEGCVSQGGTAIGILPQFMIEKNWQHPDLTEMRVTDGMHSRKEMMAELALGVVALPGGVGTLEELLEIITWRQLGLYGGNVVILNVGGYYDPLLKMLDRTIEEHFMNEDHRTLWRVASTPEEAVKMAKSPAEKHEYSTKIK